MFPFKYTPLSDSYNLFRCQFRFRLFFSLLIYIFWATSQLSQQFNKLCEQFELFFAFCCHMNLAMLFTVCCVILVWFSYIFFCRYSPRNQHHPPWVNWRSKKEIQAVFFQVFFPGETRSADYNSLPWSDKKHSDKWLNCQLIFINWKYFCEVTL